MNLKEALVSRERKRKSTDTESSSRIAESGPDSQTKPTLVRSHDPGDLHAKIANRAYELYEQRGFQDGQALEDWLQAEREFRGR